MRTPRWIGAGVLALAACASRPAARSAAPAPPAAARPSPAAAIGSSAAVGPEATAREVEQALRAYVQVHSAEGRMRIEDEALPGEWSVKLVGVHPVRIIDTDHWFACADFEGTVTQGQSSRAANADFDFHVNRVGDAWQIVKVDIHQQDGQPRERPYRCTSNPDVQSTTPGTCPLDGTPLVR